MKLPLKLLFITLLRPELGVSGLVSQSSEQIAVEQQLGYLPTNFLRVSAWTETENLPVAIQTRPVDGGAPRRRQRQKRQDVLTPFPTLYWLCNAKIATAVADLESSGHIAILKERLAATPGAGKELERAHLDYARERWSLLSNKEQELLTPGMIDILKYSGVGGTLLSTKSNEKPHDKIPSLKCLHCHYAHYRSTNNNIVGEWVHELLQLKFPNLEL